MNESIATFKKLVTDYLLSVGARPHPDPDLVTQGGLVVKDEMGELEIRGFADDAYQMIVVFHENRMGADPHPMTTQWCFLGTLAPEDAAARAIASIGDNQDGI